MNVVKEFVYYRNQKKYHTVAHICRLYIMQEIGVWFGFCERGIEWDDRVFNNRSICI